MTRRTTHFWIGIIRGSGQALLVFAFAAALVLAALALIGLWAIPHLVHR